MTPTLTPRERQVAAMIADGMQVREIADALGIACGSVKATIRTARLRLGIRSRAELAAVYVRDYEVRDAA